jgi:hypothetical protein
VLVIDGSVVGRGGVALMLHVVYKGRALPLAWRVRRGLQGHVPAERPSALVELVGELLPEGAQGVLWGDGAFDGTDRQQTVEDAGWSYVCRTGTPMTAWWAGEPLRLDTLGAWSKPGTRIALSEGLFRRAEYGPLMLICCWGKGGKAPLYLVTHRDAAEAACHFYAKRFRIERV